MMRAMKVLRRSIAAILSLSLLSSCATILYPERKGNAGGSIDVGPLILDILWFIPGLVPGIIAIAVDFSTGAIYTGGGKRKSSLDVGSEGQITIRPPAVEDEAHVELRLIDERGRVLVRDAATWSPESEPEAVSVSLAEAAALLPADRDLATMQLELVVDGNQAARQDLRMHAGGLPAADDALLVPAPMLASR